MAWLAMVAAGVMAQLLDTHATAVAEVAQQFWDRHLGPHDALASVQTIAQAQHEAGLQVDGILSPPVRAALARRPFAWPHGHSLLCDGVMHRLPAGLVAVAPDATPALSLVQTSCYRPRTPTEQAALDLVVLHWDECNSALHCFHTLLYRGLSAHLLIDADGVIFQTLDLRAACAFHARRHNPRSIGIEINNRLRVDGQGASGGPARDIVCEAMAHHARRWHITAFTPQQLQTLERLVPWLCTLLDIPLQLPLDAASPGTIASGLIDPEFSGVCGHFHLQTDKLDPGFGLWPAIEKGVRPTPVG